MAIFLRVGAWYRANSKQIPPDIEITGIIDDPDAQYPISDEIQDGGATPTLDAVLAEGNDADGATIENLADPTTDQQAATKKYVDDNSGGGPTIYTGDDSLAGNRTINMNGFFVNFTDDNGFQYLYSSPGGDSKLNNTDGNNTVRIEAAGGDAFFLLRAESISESGLVSINGDAIAKVITHTANKHNFNSILNLAVFANASPADGDIWREDNTNTGLKVRINGVTKTVTVS